MESIGQFSFKYSHFLRATIVIVFFGFVILLPVVYNYSSRTSSGELRFQNAKDFQDSQDDVEDESRRQFVPRTENGIVLCLNDCSDHGKCIQNGTNAGLCECDSGYVGMQDGDAIYDFSIHNDCSYKQKSKQKAFILSFLLGIYGADRFYIDDVTSGTLKLLFTLLLCMIPCFPLCCVCCIQENRLHYIYSVLVLSEIFVLFGVIIWWLVDWSLIVSDSMKDGNGVKLLDDM
mmetsp:Transcript_123/g.161  ORF Transcript_123/g.161 Transcript_123/m.161 type:complete len:232 (-) Transcript_123:26-721(-)